MEHIPQNIKNMLNDKSMSLQNKILSFLMFSPSNMIPNNPTIDFSELGKTIKTMVDSELLILSGFDENFNLRYELK
jgi:hypothetical protein